MAAFIQATGRSYPNPISGQAYAKPFKRPKSSKYKTHSKYPNMGKGTDYFIQFENGGPGSKPLGSDSVHYIGVQKILAYFKKDGNDLKLVIERGSGDVNLKLEWDDNPSTASTALGTVSLGNASLTQSGRKGSTKDKTGTLTSGEHTFSLSGVTGGFSVNGRGSEVCFKDNDGNDCNAVLTVAGVTTVSFDYITETEDGIEDNFRAPVYRFYRGAKRDHKYSVNPGLGKEDMGHENEDKSEALRGYNREPRNGRPVFWLMDKEVAGTTRLQVYYSYWPDNTLLKAGVGAPQSGVTGELQGTGKGRNKYVKVRDLGFIFTSESAAQQFQADGDTIRPLYEYLYFKNGGRNGKDIDHLYTTDPTQEIGLSMTGVPGPASEFKSKKDGDYIYQGIIGYVFVNESLAAPAISIKEPRSFGPIGQCIDKSGWYSYASDDVDEDGYTTINDYSYVGYRRNTSSTPGVRDWNRSQDGKPEILDSDANFEWLYGLNGAVKAAVPRYLGFEDSYDTQFLYYLYDTTYPWNGPIFSIQYELNDIPCCPNAVIPGGGGDLGDDDEPACIPNLESKSHFYEIKEDRWETTSTKISVNNVKPTAANGSFYEIDTTTPRLLFRYTSSGGTRFRVGETINGWDIVAVYYFGDELRCGLILLNGYQGNDFSYNQTFTSQEGATIKVLAGYGIANKAAFCGVYEFLKNISYYKVEINPKALIPNRTLDGAEIEAIVNKKGKIVDVNIINGGAGFTNPTITVIDPQVFDDFSPQDNADFIAGRFQNDLDYKKAIDNPVSKKQVKKNVRHATRMFGIKGDGVNALNIVTNDKGEALDLRQAKLEITEIDDHGTIQGIRIIDGGSGYRQSKPPKIFIAEPDTMEYQAPDVDAARFTQLGSEMAVALDGVSNDFSSFSTKKENRKFNKFSSDAKTNVTNSLDTIVTGSNNLEKHKIPDSYVRMFRDQENISKMCFNIPEACINVDAKGNIQQGMPPIESFDEVSANEGADEFAKNAMPYAYQAIQSLDAYNSGMSGLYGPINDDGSSCITMGQPEVFSIKKWFDMPCAYLDKVRQEGLPNIKDQDKRDKRDVGIGYLPYKYCGSDEREATFDVSLSFEGRTTGTDGAAFMNFLSKLPKPQLARKREVPDGYRTWNCNDGEVEGRCYRDPNDEDNIVFVAVGLDENTYEYTGNADIASRNGGTSEGDKFEIWLGDNLISHEPGTNHGGWTYLEPGTSTTDPETGETTTTPDITGSGGTFSWTRFNVDCDTPYPAHECWDTYVGSVLDVYCGYQSDGTPIPGQRWWEIEYNGVTNPFCVDQCPPSPSYGQYYTWIGTSQTRPPMVGLSLVMDCSIAIDPDRIQRDDDVGGKVAPMGPYSGTMKVRNYLSGGIIALGNATRNFGNPFFTECENTEPDKSPYAVGGTINENINPR